MTGFVKKLLPTFGFIKGDDGVDRFLSPRNLQKTGPGYAELKEGDQVIFEDGVNPRPTGCRFVALEVRVIRE